MPAGPGGGAMTSTLARPGSWSTTAMWYGPLKKMPVWPERKLAMASAVVALMAPGCVTLSVHSIWRK